MVFTQDPSTDSRLLLLLLLLQGAGDNSASGYPGSDSPLTMWRINGSNPRTARMLAKYGGSVNKIQ